MDSVRTRFAPSPTGYMHIGGMRTALFNWLWARHCGGAFVLRIDDTDRQRNMDEALGPILRAFRWLGLDWDEGPETGGDHGPYFQSQRGELYSAAMERLLAAGAAYRDFEPPEETRAQREAAEKEKRQYVSSRSSLELSPAEVEQKLAAGEPHVIRFLVPRDETVVVEDVVRGHVEWDCGLMPDPVVMRADGSPLYNFATVVDDAAMRISHVIRAEEHLSNTPVQVLIHRALGHELPVFAHIPYVAAPGSKEKLSKRKVGKYRKLPQFRRMFEAGDETFPRLGITAEESLDPVMVEYYERMGYLPAGLLNALARLGWSLDDRTEYLSLAEVVSAFTLERVISSPAGFDPEKLQSYQQHWMNELPHEEKVAGCLAFLVQAGQVPDPPAEEDREFVGRMVTALGDRIRIFSDILGSEEFFVADDALTWDEKAFDKRLRRPERAAELLTAFRGVLAELGEWEPEPIEQAMRDFLAARDLKMGDIIHAVRVAVTGKPAGPGMFDCLALLGQQSCLARIDRTLARLEAAGE